MSGRRSRARVWWSPRSWRSWRSCCRRRSSSLPARRWRPRSGSWRAPRGRSDGLQTVIGGALRGRVRARSADRVLLHPGRLRRPLEHALQGLLPGLDAVRDRRRALALVLLWRAARSAPAGRVALAGGIAVDAPRRASPTRSSPPRAGPSGAGPREWAGLDGAAYVGDLADGRPGGDPLAGRPTPTTATSFWRRPAAPTRSTAGCRPSRLAAFTGVPTRDRLGWARAAVARRSARVGSADRTAPRRRRRHLRQSRRSRSAVARYGVTLLYVGSFEQLGAGAAARSPVRSRRSPPPAIPGPGWTEVFRSGEARIYRRAA